MKQIINLGLLLVCMISSVLPLNAQDPYLSAMKLRGNVSCLKAYVQGWETKFGEAELEDNKFLMATLYYDKNHRLLYANEAETEYHIVNFYDYTYKDGILSEIDCYRQLSDTRFPFRYKIRLVKENGVTVGYLYDEYGREEAKYSPYYNVGCKHFWRYSDFFTDHLFYVFAFEIKPQRLKQDSRAKFNSKKQLIRQKSSDYIDDITYKYDAEGRLSVMDIGSYAHFVFDYDNMGNVKSIKTHDNYGSGNDKGSIYTFEYEYGDFETSEKFRKENYINRIKQEKARQDSIENAKQKAIEDSIANAKKQAEIAAKQAELAAKQAKEQKFEQQKEFVNAFEKAVYHKDLKILREGVTYTTSYGGRFFIVFDEDDFKTEISTDPAFASYLTYGDYRICYDDKLTCALFLSNTGKRYLIRKMADGTFKVYEIKENNSKKQKPKKNWSKYLKGLAL